MSNHSSRRKFLGQLGFASLAGVLSSHVYTALSKHGSLVKADAASKKFILYIHCGSWDGLASGLLQPNSVANWPSGVFTPGVQAIAPNPLINKISKNSQMYLHSYNKVLSEVMGNLFHATLNSRSLDHYVAAELQRTGHESEHPSWTAGFAQIFSRPENGPGIVTGVGSRLNGYSPNVAFIEASSVPGFVASFRDPVASAHQIQIKQKFGAVAAKLYQEQFGTSLIPGHFKSTFEGTHKYWSQGVPELAETSDLIKGLRSSLSLANADSLIDTHMENNDAVGVKQHGSSFLALRENLVLAGALAKSGIATGMDISLSNEDYHFGGSQVLTARSGAQLWTQLVLFWKWIVAQGMQDQVLVVVSHEFSRSPHNSYSSQIPITVGGNSVTIACPGTDHGLTAGMYLLNGKLPGGSRYGGLLDTYIAAGASDLGLPPVAEKPAATSLQVVGTALMTCFPDEFRNSREPESARNVRAVFPAMAESDVLLPLLRASS